jgi:diadenosine tetraphosphatase ApaH/serine/threonine PP2A family protein phosphatase
MADTVLICTHTARQFGTDVLIHSGLSPAHAQIIADALVLADLRGVDTHGLNRLPGYLARIRSGALNPSPDLRFVQRSPVCALLDAQNTFGFLAAHAAVKHALEMAQTFGIGVVAVKNSGHYGMAATYLLQAIDRGYAAMAFTNASRSMPAWGSREPLLGTSPFAVGLPGGAKGHFILDMSPAVVARVCILHFPCIYSLFVHLYTLSCTHPILASELCSLRINNSRVANYMNRNPQEIMLFFSSRAKSAKPPAAGNQYQMTGLSMPTASERQTRIAPCRGASSCRSVAPRAPD